MQAANKPYEPLQIGIIILGLGTAITHLGVGLTGFPLILLNGLGYFALLGLVFLPFSFLGPYRTLARRALIGYTALTFVLYFIVRGVGPDGEAFKDSLGLINKANEAVLLLLFWLSARQKKAAPDE